MIRLPIIAEHETGPALIAELLAEQQSFSAVDRFDQWHTNGDHHDETNGATSTLR